MIQLSLIPDLRHNVIDISDPLEAWQALSIMFHTNIISDIMVVLNWWEYTRMGDQQDVASFMQQINDTILDLKSIKQVRSN